MKRIITTLFLFTTMLMADEVFEHPSYFGGYKLIDKRSDGRPPFAVYVINRNGDRYKYECTLSDADFQKLLDQVRRGQKILNHKCTATLRAIEHKDGRLDVYGER